MPGQRACQPNFYFYASLSHRHTITPLLSANGVVVVLPSLHLFYVLQETGRKLIVGNAHDTPPPWENNTGSLVGNGSSSRIR